MTRVSGVIFAEACATVKCLMRLPVAQA